METTKKDFELFKSECQIYIDKFELNNYRMAYEWKKMNDADAAITSNQKGMVATFAFNKELSWGNLDYSMSKIDFIKSLAIHEVIHLLLGRYVWCGTSRFVTTDETREGEEELVRKLERLIK